MAIQFLRGTESKVSASTKVLADGQPLYEKDTHKLKVGDGSTQAKSLPYITVDTDSTLSSTSTNPIQNKVVNSELEGKVAKAGDTMTGNLTISKDANPWVGLALGDDKAYVQVFSSAGTQNISRMTMGFGSSKSIGVDANGNTFIPNTSYGDTLPDSPATNQLFFQTVGSNFVLDNVYPVGSIYMNVNSTNPGTLFGGTWEQIQGKFLLGMSSAYPAGSQGGQETVALTMSQMPKHDGHLASGVLSPDGLPQGSGNFKGFLNSNVFTEYGDTGRGWSAFAGNEMHPASTNQGGTNSLSEGQSEAHTNMPPYLSVYIWKRTA